MLAGIVSQSYSIPPKKSMDEICDNAIDDDGDGLIDINDEECICEMTGPRSLIPNPSFEDQNCCPSNRNQLDCAEVWIQASTPTTDYIHTCDYLGWDEFPPPQPFPDGEGIMGFRDGRVDREGEPERNWKEYAGACLLSPLEAGTTYRFEFDIGFVDSRKSPPITLAFFGSEDCDNLPFGGGDQTFGCPTNGPGWIKLGSTRLNGGENIWVNSFIEITPTENINAIVIGPDCPEVVSPISIYYFFDNLLLADFESFGLQIEEVEHPCSGDFSLKVFDNSDFEYQWYKEGIALIGETNAQLSNANEEGIYQVRVINDEGCRLSEPYNYVIPEFKRTIKDVICLDGTYDFGDKVLDSTGIYMDTLISVNGCDSIIMLELKELGELADSIEVKIFEGEKYKLDTYSFDSKGDHLATLKSSLDCDSLVLVQLDYYQVFIPNIFSPNGDGVNDEFFLQSDGLSVVDYTFEIFDLWGNRVYTGKRWDGTFANQKLKNGVYSYVLSVVMDDDNTRNFYGAITLVN